MSREEALRACKKLWELAKDDRPSKVAIVECERVIRKALQPQEIDVERLKLDRMESLKLHENNDVQNMHYLHRQGWNDCINHLHAQGYLSAPDTSNIDDIKRKLYKGVPSQEQIDEGYCPEDIQERIAFNDGVDAAFSIIQPDTRKDDAIRDLAEALRFYEQKWVTVGGIVIPADRLKKDHGQTAKQTLTKHADIIQEVE